MYLIVLTPLGLMFYPMATQIPSFYTGWKATIGDRFTSHLRYINSWFLTVS